MAQISVKKGFMLAAALVGLGAMGWLASQDTQGPNSLTDREADTLVRIKSLKSCYEVATSQLPHTITRGMLENASASCEKAVGMTYKQAETHQDRMLEKYGSMAEIQRRIKNTDGISDLYKRDY
jgi:hypothetical protein